MSIRLGDVYVSYWVLFIIQFIMALISAGFCYVYKTSVVDKRVKGGPINPSANMNGNKEFKYGTFGCFDDLTYCLYGCFCSLCRMADNYDMAGHSYIMNIGILWGVFQGFEIFIFFIAAVSQSPGALQVFYVLFILAEIGMIVYFAMKRADIRAALGGPGGGDNLMMDCICLWCCLPCTIIQDARQLDEATNTKVECFFQLNHLGGAGMQMVGSPVMTQG